MVAILHDITTQIEDDRMKDQLRYWKWQSDIQHNKQDLLLQLQGIFEVNWCEGLSIWYNGRGNDLDYKNEVPCENCVECFDNFYPKLDWKIPRGQRICEDCAYEPDWTDAFSKWGHNDGASNNYITSEIVDTIEELGYKCKVESWGLHNQEVIIEIVKCHNNETEIVYDLEKNSYSYDEEEFYNTMPRDILEALTGDPI